MNYKHLIRRMLILASELAAAAQSVKAGIEAWQKGDYAAAVAIWRPLAEQGDADAAVQPRPGLSPRARRADQPVGGADMVRTRRQPGPSRCAGDTWPADVPERRPGRRTALAEAAALKGEPRALLVYGTALFNGDGVTQDPVMGYAFVSRAAAQGLGPAKDTLAQMDKILPLEGRKKGVALAIANARTPAPKSHTITVKPPKLPSQRRRPSPRRFPSRNPRRCRRRNSGKTGAWRVQLGAFSQKRVGRSAVPQAFGERSAGRPPRLLHPGRRDHPAAGRAIRVPRRRERRVQRAQRPGLLRRGGQVAKRKNIHSS